MEMKDLKKPVSTELLLSMNLRLISLACWQCFEWFKNSLMGSALHVGDKIHLTRAYNFPCFPPSTRVSSQQKTWRERGDVIVSVNAACGKDYVVPRAIETLERAKYKRGSVHYCYYGYRNTPDHAFPSA